MATLTCTPDIQIIDPTHNAISTAHAQKTPDPTSCQLEDFYGNLLNLLDRCPVGFPGQPFPQDLNQPLLQ